jgi:hypothetical protein
MHHRFAKELLAGFAGAEVDKLVETKGLNYLDRERAKSRAEEQAVGLYEQHYGEQDWYDPYVAPRPALKYPERQLSSNNSSAIPWTAILRCSSLLE